MKAKNKFGKTNHLKQYFKCIHVKLLISLTTQTLRIVSHSNNCIVCSIDLGQNRCDGPLKAGTKKQALTFLCQVLKLLVGNLCLANSNHTWVSFVVKEEAVRRSSEEKTSSCEST